MLKSGRYRRITPRRGRVAMTITDWLLDDNEVLERIEEALAELEKQELLRYARSIFREEPRSIPVEHVAEKAGVHPIRVIKLVGERQRSLDIHRVKCPRTSRYGWCLKHKDYYDGVAKYYPEIASAVKELTRIQAMIRMCSDRIRSPPGVPVPCRINNYEELLQLIMKAQVLAEELGIPEADMPQLRRWLGLEHRLTLRDGSIVKRGELVSEARA